MPSTAATHEHPRKRSDCELLTPDHKDTRMIFHGEATVAIRPTASPRARDRARPRAGQREGPQDADDEARLRGRWVLLGGIVATVGHPPRQEPQLREERCDVASATIGDGALHMVDERGRSRFHPGVRTNQPDATKEARARARYEEIRWSSVIGLADSEPPFVCS